jgi:hypothetical protein
MKRTRDELHAEAERITRALVVRFGGELPEDIRTTLSFYVSSRNGVDRAAEHVLLLRSHLKPQT